jgi:hypothetical protein
MNISLSEIWNFIELIDNEENGWSYALHASNVSIEGISQQILMELKNDINYDTELLPSIFTFREILWQPDVFTEASMSLPGLRILKAFCEETAAEYGESKASTFEIYGQLISGLGVNCEAAIKLIDATEAEGVVTKALGELRRISFPIIKFFIYHPQNRIDYYRDAVNRLNYAVKISLTQFHGRYTELKDPYWVVNYQKNVAKPKKQTIKRTD